MHAVVWISLLTQTHFIALQRWLNVRIKWYLPGGRRRELLQQEHGKVLPALATGLPQDLWSTSSSDLLGRRLSGTALGKTSRFFLTTTAGHTTADIVTEGMVSNNVHASSQTSQLIKMKEALEQGTSYCSVLLTENSHEAAHVSMCSKPRTGIWSIFQTLFSFSLIFIQWRPASLPYGEGEGNRRNKSDA